MVIPVCEFEKLYLVHFYLGVAVLCNLGLINQPQFGITQAHTPLSNPMGEIKVQKLVFNISVSETGDGLWVTTWTGQARIPCLQGLGATQRTNPMFFSKGNSQKYNFVLPVVAQKTIYPKEIVISLSGRFESSHS